MNFFKLITAALTLCVMAVAMVLGVAFGGLWIIEYTGLWSIVIFCGIIFIFCAAALTLENNHKYSG